MHEEGLPKHLSWLNRSPKKNRPPVRQSLLKKRNTHCSVNSNTDLYNRLVTTRRGKSSIMLMRPSNWMNVGARWISPIIVDAIPAVEMHKEPISNYVCHGSHTQGMRGVSPVYSFKLHTNAKCTRQWILMKKSK